MAAPRAVAPPPPGRLGGPPRAPAGVRSPGRAPYGFARAPAPHDPPFAFARWPHPLSAYGPLFPLGSSPLAFIGVPAALWTLKAVAAAASLGCVALVWRIAGRLGHEPVRA